MSIRVDTTPLVAGAVVVGVPGLGVLGAQVPSTGDSGAAPLYNDITLPADNTVELRVEILTWPTQGTLTMAEDSSFEWPAIGESVPDGDYSFTYRMYRDGVVGSTFLVSLQMGSGAVVGATLHVWNGTSWVPSPLQIWDGATWVTAQLKVWDGNTWQTVQ